MGAPVARFLPAPLWRTARTDHRQFPGDADRPVAQGPVGCRGPFSLRHLRPSSTRMGVDSGGELFSAKGKMPAMRSQDRVRPYRDRAGRRPYWRPCPVGESGYRRSGRCDIWLAAADAGSVLLIVLLALSGLAAGLFSLEPCLPDRLIGGIAGFASLATIAAVYRMIRKRDGLGAGDPKMLGAIGCWLGWQALPLVILGASLVGILVAISWRWRGQSVSVDSMLPLGSLMAVAAFPLWLLQTGSGGALY